jgi:hypothetical protein
VVKRSQAYRSIRRRVRKPYPSDSWYEEGLAFVTFDLHPETATTVGENGGGPHAVFVLAATPGELLAARLVHLAGAGGKARVQDLLIAWGSA